ncbi:hypothetical protein BJ912DRAFT_979314 [Pholiota molesta]|nr:hypothetical protein BJ912DRAFT_979314 [Pholiota molesta]
MRCLLVDCRYVFKTHRDFLKIMEEESHEMMEFSTTLFDAHSNVRPWLVDVGYRRGSGCWGAELSTGGMVYIENLTVKESLRKRGRSSFVLTLLEKANVFCRPMPPRNEMDASNWDAKVERVNKFFQWLRRIGHAHDYPLHSAIANNNTVRIAAILASAHASDQQNSQPDSMGFTPLHVAASVAESFRSARPAQLCAAGDLRNASNKEHLTPLDRLQDTMLWDGYPREALVCEFLLRKALRVPPILESEEEYIVKRRFGCTCGSCTDQWLSPRMRRCLKVIAEVDHDIIWTELDNHKSNEPLIHAAFFQGYCSLFSAFATILDDSDYGNPTATRVLAQALHDDRHVNFYINEGGRVDYALDAIIDCAKDQSVLGDGEFEAIYDDIKQGCEGPYYDEDVEMHGEDEDDEDY